MSSTVVAAGEDLLDEVPTAIMVVGGDGLIERANRRACEILRHPGDRLLGRPIAAVLAPLSVLLAHGRDGSEREPRRELTIQLSDGKRATIGLTIARLNDGRHTMVFQDVTTWARLREERDRLLQLAVVGDIMPTLLHELKNPLAAITTSLELLIEDTPAGSVQDQLHAILTEGRRMKLSLEGVGAVGLQLRSTRYAAVDHACREACRVLAGRAASKGVRLRDDVHDMPLLDLDPPVVRALVFNLVGNAIDACEPGAPGATVLLHARLVDGGRRLEINVTDTGAGMPAGVVEQCTELFFTTKRTGSGIGLALCRRAVEGAGGRLHIASVPAIGTSVTIEVPVGTGTVIRQG